MDPPSPVTAPGTSKLCVATFEDPLERCTVRVSIPLVDDRVTGKAVRAAVLQRLQHVSGGYDVALLVVPQSASARPVPNSGEGEGEREGESAAKEEGGTRMTDEDVFACDAAKRVLRMRLIVVLVKPNGDRLNTDLAKFGSPEGEQHNILAEFPPSLPPTPHLPQSLPPPPGSEERAEGDQPAVGVKELLDTIAKLSAEGREGLPQDQALALATAHCKKLAGKLLESDDNLRCAVELEALRIIPVCMKANQGCVEFQIRACSLVRHLCTSAVELDGFNIGDQIRLAESNHKPSRHHSHHSHHSHHDHHDESVHSDSSDEHDADHRHHRPPVNAALYACLVVLRSYSNDPRAVTVAAGALTFMLWQRRRITHKHLTLLIAFGGVETVMEAFRAVESNADAVAAVANLLQLIASDGEVWANQEMWVEVVRLCVGRLQSHTLHVHKQRTVVWLLAYLLSRPGVEQTAVEAGVVGAALGALHKHSTVVSLVQAVMQLLVNITFFDGSAAPRQISEHAGHVLLCLISHSSNQQVQHLGCGLLRNMAIELKGDNAALERLSSAPEVVIAAIKAFPTNAKIVENGFSFLWTFTAARAERQGEGMELALATILQHPNSVAVHRQAFGFLRTVLLDAEDMQAEFIAQGGLGELLRVMKHFRHEPDIVAHCLRALYALSKLDSNRAQLLGVGCLKEVIVVLPLHPENEDVQNWGLSVVWNVGTTGPAADDGMQELLRLTALPVVVAAMTHHPLSFDVQQDCVNILLNMAHGRYGISQMHQWDVGSIVRGVRKQHPRLKKECSALLRHLEESDCKAM